MDISYYLILGSVKRQHERAELSDVASRVGSSFTLPQERLDVTRTDL